MLARSVKILVSRLNSASYYMPSIALAEILNYPKNIADTPEKIEGLFQSASDWFFTIFLIVAVISLIYTAFMYLTAAGDTTKVSKAKTALVISIVAIVIALLAGSMPILLQNILENKTTYPDPGEPCDPPGPC